MPGRAAVLRVVECTLLTVGLALLVLGYATGLRPSSGFDFQWFSADGGESSTIDTHFYQNGGYVQNWVQLEHCKRRIDYSMLAFQTTEDCVRKNIEKNDQGRPSIYKHVKQKADAYGGRDMCTIGCTAYQDHEDCSLSYCRACHVSGIIGIVLFSISLLLLGFAASVSVWVLLAQRLRCAHRCTRRCCCWGKRRILVALGVSEAGSLSCCALAVLIWVGTCYSQIHNAIEAQKSLGVVHGPTASPVIPTWSPTYNFFHGTAQTLGANDTVSPSTDAPTRTVYPSQAPTAYPTTYPTAYPAHWTPRPTMASVSHESKQESTTPLASIQIGSTVCVLAAAGGAVLAATICGAAAAIIFHDTDGPLNRLERRSSRADEREASRRPSSSSAGEGTRDEGIEMNEREGILTGRRTEPRYNEDELSVLCACGRWCRFGCTGQLACGCCSCFRGAADDESSVGEEENNSVGSGGDAISGDDKSGDAKAGAVELGNE